MNLQVIKNSEGKPTGVFIPIKEWTKLKKVYKELNDLESKNSILNDIKDSLIELSQVEKGKLKARPISELIDEL